MVIKLWDIPLVSKFWSAGLLRLCGNLAHSVHFLHFASHLQSRHKLTRVYASSVLSIDSSGRSCAKGGEGTRCSGSVTHLTRDQESLIMLCNKRAKFTWDDVRAWTRSFYTKMLRLQIFTCSRVKEFAFQKLFFCKRNDPFGARRPILRKYITVIMRKCITDRVSTAVRLCCMSLFFEPLWLRGWPRCSQWISSANRIRFSKDLRNSWDAISAIRTDSYCFVVTGPRNHLSFSDFLRFSQIFYSRF